MTQNPVYPPQPPVGAGVSPFTYPPPQRGNGLAVAGLICGIVGFCVLFIGGIIGLILGILGLRKTRDPQIGGRGVAIAAIVVSSLSLLTSLFTGVMIAFSGGMMALGFSALAKQSVAPRAAARSFVQDLNGGNTPGARAVAGAGITDQELAAMSAKLRALGTFRDMTSYGINLNNTNGIATCRLNGAAVFTGGNATYELNLESDHGGPWRITSASFP